MDSRNVLIVNYASMRSGGIETHLALIMQYALNNGWRVVWITTKKLFNIASYREIIDDFRLEKVFCTKKQRIFGTYPKINIKQDDEVVMISPSTNGFILAESIRKKYKCKEFNHLHVLAHFAGDCFYPEEFYRIPLLKKMWSSYYKNIAQWSTANNNLRAFHVSHYEAYEVKYGVRVENRHNVVPSPGMFADISSEKALEKARRREGKFIILACARFEFPHKEFILGIIDEFESIFACNDKIELRIVGFGQGEKEVRNHISRLSEMARSKVILYPEMDYFRLRSMMEESHAVIGVSGTVHDAGCSGTPALIAKVYSRACEIEGIYMVDVFEASYHPDANWKTLKDSLIRLFDMSDEEYSQMLISILRETKNRFEFDLGWVLRQKTTDNVLSQGKIWLAWLEKIFEGLAGLFRKRK